MDNFIMMDSVISCVGSLDHVRSLYALTRRLADPENRKPDAARVQYFYFFTLLVPV